MSKHTQKPWTWIFSGGSWSLVHQRDEYHCDFVHTGGPPDVPLTADQLLIAAAPDLLAALIEARCWLRWPGKTPEKMGAKCEVEIDMKDMVDAAIAKAGGAK